jgi:hypothetical protein
LPRLQEYSHVVTADESSFSLAHSLGSVGGADLHVQPDLLPQRLMAHVEGGNASTAEVQELLTDYHELSMRNRTLELQLQHVQLQLEAIRADNDTLHVNAEEAREVQSRLEEHVLLLQTKLRDIATFEGAQTEQTLQRLRGTLLSAAHDEMEQLRSAAKRAEMSKQLLERTTTEERMRYESEVRALRTELNQQSRQLAQRAVLFASKERQWKESVSSSQQAQVDQSARANTCAAKLEAVQEQLDRSERLRSETSLRAQELASVAERLRVELDASLEKQAAADADAVELRNHCSALQSELERLRRADTDHVQLEFAREMQELRLQYDRDIKSLKHEVNSRNITLREREDEVEHLKHSLASARQRAAQSEDALQSILSDRASSDPVVAKLLQEVDDLKRGADCVDSPAVAEHEPACRETIKCEDKSVGVALYDPADAERHINELRVLRPRICELEEELARLQSQLYIDNAEEIRQQIDAQVAARIQAAVTESQQQFQEERNSLQSEAHILHAEIEFIRKEKREVQVLVDLHQRAADAAAVSEEAQRKSCETLRQTLEETATRHSQAIIKVNSSWNAAINAMCQNIFFVLNEPSRSRGWTPVANLDIERSTAQAFESAVERVKELALAYTSTLKNLPEQLSRFAESAIQKSAGDQSRVHSALEALDHRLEILGTAVTACKQVLASQPQKEEVRLMRMQEAAQSRKEIERLKLISRTAAAMLNTMNVREQSIALALQNLRISCDGAHERLQLCQSFLLIKARSSATTMAQLRSQIATLKRYRDVSGMRTPYTFEEFGADDDSLDASVTVSVPTRIVRRANPATGQLVSRRKLQGLCVCTERLRVELRELAKHVRSITAKLYEELWQMVWAVARAYATRQIEDRAKLQVQMIG